MPDIIIRSCAALAVGGVVGILERAIQNTSPKKMWNPGRPKASPVSSEMVAVECNVNPRCWLKSVAGKKQTPSPW